MAEAMELDLTLKKIVDETIKNPIAPPPDFNQRVAIHHRK